MDFFCCIGIDGVLGVGVGGGFSASEAGVAPVVEPFLFAALAAAGGLDGPV